MVSPIQTVSSCKPSGCLSQNASGLLSVQMGWSSYPSYPAGPSCCLPQARKRSEKVARGNICFFALMNVFLRSRSRSSDSKTLYFQIVSISSTHSSFPSSYQMPVPPLLISDKYLCFLRLMGWSLLFSLTIQVLSPP